VKKGLIEDKKFFKVKNSIFVSISLLEVFNKLYFDIVSELFYNRDTEFLGK